MVMMMCALWWRLSGYLLVESGSIAITMVFIVNLLDQVECEITKDEEEGEGA